VFFGRLPELVKVNSEVVIGMGDVVAVVVITAIFAVCDLLISFNFVALNFQVRFWFTHFGSGRLCTLVMNGTWVLDAF
jgi:hypothetical protein